MNYDDVEIWQPVPYEPFNLYFQISSHGRIRRKERHMLRKNKGTTLSKVTVPSAIIKPRTSKTCHYLHATIRVSHNGKEIQKNVYPHTMCAIIFVENDDPEKTKISFKDGDPFNIHYTNLFWVTQSYLSKLQFIRNPKTKDRLYLNRLKNGKALTREQHEEIRKMFARGTPENIIADKFKVTLTTIKYHTKGLK